MKNSFTTKWFMENKRERLQKQERQSFIGAELTVLDTSLMKSEVKLTNFNKRRRRVSNINNVS